MSHRGNHIRIGGCTGSLLNGDAATLEAYFGRVGTIFEHFGPGDGPDSGHGVTMSVFLWNFRRLLRPLLLRCILLAVAVAVVANVVIIETVFSRVSGIGRKAFAIQRTMNLFFPCRCFNTADGSRCAPKQSG